MSNKEYLYEKFQIEEYMVNFLNDVLSTQWDTKDKKEIVFLGDSLIRDYDLSRFFPNIKEKLFNCGVSGITTEGLFNILKQGVVRHKPKTIVILAGTNDMNEYNDKRDGEIIFNIARIITKLKIILQEVNIVLISILPCDEKRYGKEVVGGGRENSRIIKVNEELKNFERYFKDLYYIDVFKSFVDKSGNLINSLTHDGLHLNIKGYEKLTVSIEPIVNMLLKKD